MKHQESEEGESGVTQVFLGGVCGTTTWRKDMAIPILDDRNIKYFNPQVEEGQWDESLIG